MARYAAPGTDGSVVTFKNRYDHFIGGEYVAPKKGQYFENPTPVTGQTFTEVARGTAEDVEAALDAAHAAAPSGGRPPSAERANILNKMADRIEEKLEAIAVAESWENGKPVRETLAADIPLAIDHLRYFAGAIRAQEGSLSEIDDDTVAYHFHEPLGVVGQIIPWNFPILMAIWKLAPALAAGNAVVLKPAEQTPTSIHVLHRGGRRPAAARRAEHRQRLRRGGRQAAGVQQRIRKIAFTGETTTGRLIMQYASQNLIPVTLELGGKSPNIFFDDVARDPGRLLRQGAGGLRHVRPQPGRGLHLPVARADPGRDLRRLRRRGGQAHRADQAGPPARHRDHDRRPGVERPAREDPLLHRHRPAGGREGPHRWRARRPRRRAVGRLLHAADRSSRATTRCGSSRRRSSARWWP